MPRIYIISRTDETSNLSDYMAELLRARYGPQNVMRGTTTRTVAEYAAAVERDLRACDVALVVIGPRWLTNPDASGHPWLARADDPTRIALATALRLRMLVAPVLSEGARMPSEADLPPDLHALPQIQGFPVRPAPAFYADMTRLYQQINTKLTWRPASSPLIALTSASGSIWIALGILRTFATATNIVLASATILALAAAISLIVASILALTLAIRRKGRKWAWIITATLALMLGLFVSPFSMGLLGAELLVAVLLVFGFIGPRRETAFA